MTYYQKIQQLIGQNKIKEAFALSFQIADKFNGRLSSDLTLQMGRWNGNEKQYTSNLISHSDYSLTKSQVESAVLSLISENARLFERDYEETCVIDISQIKERPSIPQKPQTPQTETPQNMQNEKTIELLESNIANY